MLRRQGAKETSIASVSATESGADDRRSLSSQGHGQLAAAVTGVSGGNRDTTDLTGYPVTS
jgi:hypothetical protein